jgi:hypothetical protein
MNVDARCGAPDVLIVKANVTDAMHTNTVADRRVEDRREERMIMQTQTDTFGRTAKTLPYFKQSV